MSKKNTIRDGEIVEAIVIAKCIKEKYRVSIPFGSPTTYDFVLDSGNNLFRVQVKKIYPTRGSMIANFRKGGGNVWNDHAKTRSRKYSEDDCDVLIAYSLEHDLAYVFPIKDIQDRYQATVYPDNNFPNRKKLFGENYREAWNVFDDTLTR